MQTAPAYCPVWPAGLLLHCLLHPSGKKSTGRSQNVCTVVKGGKLLSDVTKDIPTHTHARSGGSCFSMFVYI